MLKKLLLALVALVALLAAAVAVNTLRQGSRQLQVPPAPQLAVDHTAVAETLAALVRLRTVSVAGEPQANADQFRALHAELQRRFPRVHATLQREVVGDFSLLYTWKGSDPSARPVALMAHHDVVPVAPGTETAWTVPAFEGRIADGHVWGRGTWDDKGNLVAQLQAIETLLAAGHRPQRTIVLVSGADEELGGLRGAAEIVKLLKARGLRFEFVIDEGLVLTEGVVPGVRAPAALVGIAEKGYITVQLTARAAPGHGSMPPPAGTSAIAKLSAALQRLDQDQFKPELQGVARALFDTLAPEMGGLQRVVLSNLWLTKPLVEAQLARAPSTNAMLRTTTALTMVSAGNKFNVIPGQAQAVLDFRILPGDTREDVLRHVRARVGPDVEVQAIGGSTDPTPVTPTDSASYRHLERTLRALFPDTVVAPALYVAGSDSQHFVPIADAIYRFSPIRAKPADLPRLHGTDERISIRNLAELVRFYHQLIAGLNTPAT